MSPSRNALDAGKPLSIVIIGASGDLARRKLLPALFYIYCQDFLPEDFHLFGFARSPMTDDEFRARCREHLTCRYAPGEQCEDRMEAFLSRCRYHAGQYASADDLLDLFQLMRSQEKTLLANRLYYLAIPPSVFTEVARSLGRAGLVACGKADAWARVVIEKPFGRDRASSDEMADELSKVFGERDIYRIDHYLGKEVIQNLMVLRFANPIFEPLWSHIYIDNVQISWKEDLGIGSRAGYFDEFGIIRDVMQNHLLQILSLIAMEEPFNASAQCVRDEKVRALKCVPPLTLDDLVLGQYLGARRGAAEIPAYAETPGVPPDSITPTFAAAALRVNNKRWEGVPFLVRAGKGVESRMSEIRIQFRPKAKNIFADVMSRLPKDELVIRVQPNEAIYFRVVNKVPGLKMTLTESDLNLRYESTFRQNIPDAYETLLLDALRGEKSLFIRNDELQAAWDIFTPVLHEIDRRRITPEPYAFGGQGPESAAELALRYGVQWR